MKNLKFLLKYSKTLLIPIILSVFCALIFVPCTVLIPYFVGNTIDYFNIAATEGISSVIENIKLSLFLIGLFIVLGTIFQYVFESLVNIFIERVIMSLRNDLFKKINSIPLNKIDYYREGDLVNRLTTDIENISNGLISGYKQLFQGAITILFVLGFMYYLNWLLATIILVLTPASFILSYFISKNTNKYFKSQTAENGKLSNITLETFSNLDIVKSFNLENEFIEKFESENSELYKVGQKAQYFSSFTNPSTRLINNTIYVVVAIVGAFLVVFSEEVEFLKLNLLVGGVLTFLQYATQFAKPLNEISSCISEIQLAMSSLGRVKEIIELQNDIDEGKIENESSINKIRFDHVKFGYSEDRILFNDLNFEVLKGKKVAIVGPTGSGKTTIISLLLRFYELNSGNIYIDENEYKDLSKKCLRNKFGMVLQESWIFKGTVLENLKYAKPDATMEEVIEATKKARCYHLINRLPKGFDTIISDNEGLSKGEKQLISIARIMLSSIDFIILDEATSNVDTRAEKLIGDAFDELMKGKTSIVIAHRLSTIKSSDVILVLNDGMIVEQGNHKELLDKKGMYYKIYKAQFE